MFTEKVIFFVTLPKTFKFCYFMTLDDSTRSHAMSVAKGIAIIAMVIGHAEAPGLITNFIYTWHMPLFFMAAGYFFSERTLDNPWGFVEKRFSKLYVPFVKWSLVFLLLHNIWFHFGILNESFGNWTGGTTHPYTLRTAVNRVVQIFTSMSGYDEFMAGAFWFFRGLLVASIVFMVLYRLLRRSARLGADASLAVVMAACVAFVALRLAFGIKLQFYPNGAWRETWGVFFFAAGVLLRRREAWLPSHPAAVAVGLILMLGAGVLHLSGMNNHALWRDLWSLPLTGVIGFATVLGASRLLGFGTAARALAYVGANTMPVFVFHILAYKPVSMLKVWWYGLDPLQVGCHMVVHFNNTDAFWVLYSVVGVSLPLAVDYAVKKLRGQNLYLTVARASRGRRE